MKYNIDKIKINNNNIYTSGWVKGKNFKIILAVNGKEYTVENYFERKDLKYTFKEDKKNKYGFKQEFTCDKKVKKVKIILETKDGRKVIHTETNYKILKAFDKVKRLCKKIIRAVKFLWREYKFIVPFYMVKIYIKKFLTNTPRIVVYNPNIKSEYNMWLSTNSYTKNKKKQELTYISTEKNNIDTIICTTDLLKQLKKVKTEYVCLINGRVDFVKKFEEQVYVDLKDNDVLYFDNDYIVNKEYVNPSFKPKWSVDTLMGVNYIGNCIIIKKDILKKYKFDNNNIYEILLNLRFKDVKIDHIENIMYHDYNVKQNNLNTLKKYVKDNKIPCKITKGYDSSVSTILYNTKPNPLISIIIPTKDGADILETCLNSLYKLTTYKNFEVIIVDNGSSKKETFDVFNKYLKKYDNIKIIRIDCEFNYSYLNNEAVKLSKGEYVLLLNNDIEIITSNWLEVMLGYTMQSHVGTVGVKLLFPDNTIQHAGVLMGKGGLAGHIHYMKDRNYPSQQNELKIPYNYSVCTAACLMMKKSVFNEVGGLEEKLKVAFNDVDLNLKILEKGYYNVFLPNVVLYHHESKSRGLDTTPEKQKRFAFELNYILEQWKSMVDDDPFYNNNYSVVEDYMLVEKNERK